MVCDPVYYELRFKLVCG